MTYPDRTITVTENEYQMILDSLALSNEDYEDEADAFDRMQNPEEAKYMREVAAEYGALYDKLMGR